MGNRVVEPAVVCKTCGHTEKHEVLQYVCDYCGFDIQEKESRISGGSRKIGRWIHQLLLRRPGGDSYSLIEKSDEYNFCSNEHKWFWIKDNIKASWVVKYGSIHFGLGVGFSMDEFIEMTKILGDME